MVRVGLWLSASEWSDGGVERIVSGGVRGANSEWWSKRSKRNS